MRKTLKHSITGYNMPIYLTEILTRHYCGSFLRMSVIRERDAYMFTYETGRLERIEIKALDTAHKLLLIETLIKINRENEEHLVMADSYLIEPELLYSINNGVAREHIRILFYPDFKKMTFEHKIRIFIDKITDRRKQSEVEMFEQLKEHIGRRNTIKTLRYIGKAYGRYISEHRTV